MLQKIRQNPQLSHFLLYLASDGLYGLIIAVAGPVIPFLAAKYGRPETDFVFMFWCRSVGFIVGGFATKCLSKSLDYHQIIFYSTISIGVCFGLFPFIYSIPIQGLLVLLGSAACSSFQIIILICYMEAFKGNDEEFWLQISVTFLTIFALLCPVIAGFTGEMAYFFIGVCYICLSVFYKMLPTPETLQHSHIGENHQEEKGIQIVSRKTEIGLALMIFFYYAEQTGFGGWIPSYSVIKGAFEKEQSAFLVSLFWTATGISRFVFTSMKLSISSKLTLFFKLRGVTFIGSIVLLLCGLTKCALIFSCIIAGISYSSTYACIFTLPLQYRRKLEPSHIANIVIFGTFGEGFWTSMQGYCMKYISPDVFYPFLGAIALMEFFVLLYILQSLQKGTKKSEMEQELIQMPEIQ